MGNYNPHAPYILGQEWVPIRQANYRPDKVTERGYTFGIDHSAVPVTGAYYVSAVPEGTVNQVSDLISVYTAGQEAITGPIKQVFIPVSAVWVTGAAVSGANVTNLLNPSDGRYMVFTAPSDFNTQVGLSFNVSSYSQQLFGKRILDVSFRYVLAGAPEDIANVSARYGFAKDLFGNGIAIFVNLEGEDVTTVGEIEQLSVSDLNPFWDASLNVYQNHNIYPWRFQELSRFMSTEIANSRMVFLLNNNLLSNSVFFYFFDMMVTYCEENRLLYGGRITTSLQDPLGTATQDNYEQGPNLVRLMNPSFQSGSTTLTPGDYTVTLIHDDLPIDENVGSPEVYAARELYQLPDQRGIQVNQSLTPDTEFTSEELDFLPEITLHTSAAVVTGVHPYGIVAGAPVYGSITATQEIEDDPVGTSTQFPQVRFYARRFGNTTIPLTLIDVATGTFTVSISVADFDALPEIVDGWREVNLRFTSPPSFATAAGDVDWRWTATSETAGNQWQVLSAGSRAFAAHSIGPASYYAPVGNTVTLTWQSPTISGTADDTLADAVLIFSQDPPSVSGLSSSTCELELTVSENCLVPSRCIPTEIHGIQLTWTAPAVTGALADGGLEIQRYDGVDADDDWSTIYSGAVTSSFCDFEARVGVLTSYRVRTFNALDFYSPWVTGSGTIPSPGVGTTGDGNSVLIFTSNRSPSAGLAYPMNWEGQPIETFAFPEADTVTLERMFGKNFFTAFHPLERGGEQFTRTLLVNAAAIALPSLANFRSLRDLAWDDLDYVCVRDELGNRWFANVRVPSGEVRMDRTVYLAQIQVSEVTSTPSPADGTET